MSSFTLIKTNIRRNLNDLGVISYSADDLDASSQDAYDDITSQTLCIIKKVTLNWSANLSYYDFKTDFGVTDFLATVAIYNNVNKQWLADNASTRDFDAIRIDWELATGSPSNWAAINYKYTAVFPRYNTAAGTFDLYYWATAPTIVDANIPLIASDFQHLLEKYSTADLLEQFEEYTIASPYWEFYVENIEIYKERVQNLSKTDFLLKI